MTKNEDGICAECRAKLPYINEPRCMKCGKPIQKQEEEFCFDCQKKKHDFEEGRSVWVHKEPVNDAIYRFKYHNLKCYGAIFGKEMAKKFIPYLEERGVEALVPIPLSEKRYRTRGYNQAQILAEHIAEASGIPVENMLFRVKETSPQKQLNDVERKKNIENAFIISGRVTAKTVVLIDDIYTTGSTLDEAASVLRKAGVSKVYFLTISIGQGF